MTRWLLRMVVAVILGLQLQANATAQGTMPPPGYPPSMPVPPQGFGSQAAAPQQGFIPAAPMQQQAIPMPAYPQQPYVPAMQPAQQQVPQQGYVVGTQVTPGLPVYHDVQCQQPGVNYNGQYGIPNGQYGNPNGQNGFANGPAANGTGWWAENSWVPFVNSPPRYPLPPDPYYNVASGEIEGGILRRACLSTLNACGTGCYATHNNLGCSSCQAQLVFVFGSCRQFFGTSCTPQPPKPHPCMNFLQQCMGGGLLGGGGCGPNGCPNNQ